MNIIKLLVVLGIVGAGYHFWTGNHTGHPSGADTSIASENGFVELPPVEGQNSDAVLIAAAMNCPHEAAQRADALANDLSRKGIPVIRTQHIGFSLTNPEDPAVDHISSVMNGKLPIVFVHGKAKANPTLEEVVAEYGNNSQLE